MMPRHARGFTAIVAAAADSHFIDYDADIAAFIGWRLTDAFRRPCRRYAAASKRRTDYFQLDELPLTLY